MRAAITRAGWAALAADLARHLVAVAFIVAAIGMIWGEWW